MRRRITVTILALVQVLVLIAGVAAAATRFATQPLDQEGIYVLLMLGSDEGPPRSGTAVSGRADGFHVVVIPEDRSEVTIMAFPRDSYVPVPGFGTTKINAALTRGPDNAAATVTSLTGLQVDDWVVTGFAGLANAIDEIGGLTIDVEERLRDPFSGTNLQPGVQTLPGGKVLAYSRDRKSRSGGDLGRSLAQAKVLQAMHAQFVRDGLTPQRALELAGIFRKYTASSIPTHRLFRLAGLASSIPPERITRVLVPGSMGWAGKASVVRLSGGAYAMFEDLRTDGKLDRTR